MRETFKEELDTVGNELVEMTRITRSAMSRATDALLDADLQLAETVISGDKTVDQLARDVETRVVELMARQQPVASDLRAIVTALRMSGDLERMGDNTTHLAKIARLRHPDSAIPEELRPTILEMCQIAERLVAKAGTVIASRDVETALELDHDDDRMDQLHRELFRVLLSPEWAHGVQSAIDVTLCGRHYERYADHAVQVAVQVIYLVTGEHAEDLSEVRARSGLMGGEAG
jgi:phosphate transport system protein